MKAFSVKRLWRKLQTEGVYSFCGGYPILPTDLEWPHCQECERPLTFMFQIRFPEVHVWAGRTLAMFYCVECASESTALPGIQSSDLPGQAANQGVIRIDNPNLEDYQVNFRTLVFGNAEATTLRREHEPRVRYGEFRLSETASPNRSHLVVGGKPLWKHPEHQEDSVVYKGRELDYLMQIPDWYTLPKTPSAPHQRVSVPGGTTELRAEEDYLMFGGLQMLFFGSERLGKPEVALLGW